MKITTRKIQGRQFHIYKSESREIRLADAGNNSCGDRLGWYFTVFGEGLHAAGVDSRSSGIWYETLDQAFAIAQKI
jgi:hypothetical protein